VSDNTVGHAFEFWAQNEPKIRAVLMLGSRAQRSGEIGSSDEGSDWDYHVITSDTDSFLEVSWTERARLPAPLAYVARAGRLSQVTKVSAIFPAGEIDIVLLPLVRMRIAKLLMRLGIAPRVPALKKALGDLTLVLRPGYRLVKGNVGWSSFFSSVTSQIPSPRLNNRIICQLAEGYVIDYISTRQKILRGEYLAAQRWLHLHLSETNLQLLHELRLRSNRPSFPDARRFELLDSDEWSDSVRVSALPDRQSLLIALEKSAKTCRGIVWELVGSEWKWPDVP
jgi:hypothetical protein